MTNTAIAPITQNVKNPAFPISPKTRQGLNCILSYTTGTGRKAINHKYRVRCNTVTSGYTMISTESQSRLQRAYYPHQTAPTQFSLVIDLVGLNELISFTNYLMGYADLMLNQSTTAPIQMSAQVPSRNFSQVGIPIQGFKWGTHVGAMVYTAQLVFETSGTPGDPANKGVISGVTSVLSSLESPSSRYFYPTGIQLHGDASPEVGIGAATDPVSSAIQGAVQQSLPPPIVKPTLPIYLNGGSPPAGNALTQPLVMIFDEEANH